MTLSEFTEQVKQMMEIGDSCEAGPETMKAIALLIFDTGAIEWRRESQGIRLLIGLAINTRFDVPEGQLWPSRMCSVSKISDNPTETEAAPI